MKKLAFLCCIIAASLIGCHKSETAPQGPSSDQKAAQPGAPASSPTVPAQADKPLPPPPRYITANADNNVRQNAGGAADPFLTTQLRAFVSKTGRLPQSFAEFASKSLDSVPQPPAGKRWVIDSATQEVKAVDK